MTRTIVLAMLLALVPPAATASWQLIPGKTYDGHRPLSNYSEPCWSAAISKCAWEQRRAKALQMIKKQVPR